VPPSVALYRQNDRLELDEPAGHGFFDPGRGRDDRTLTEWWTDAVDPNAREVLLVEQSAPPMPPNALQTLLSTASAMLALRTSVADKFKLLAEIVSASLGNLTFRDDQYEQWLTQLKARRRTNVIPLHEMIGGLGICRHRALLFKVLCDALSQNPEHGPPLRCALVRGDHGAVGHAWNEVVVFGEVPHGK
jgi:hypothetical protein